jgi:hypothetical protein
LFSFLALKFTAGENTSLAIDGTAAGVAASHASAAAPLLVFGIIAFRNLFPGIVQEKRKHSLLEAVVPNVDAREQARHALTMKSIGAVNIRFAASIGMETCRVMFSCGTAATKERGTTAKKETQTRDTRRLK